LPSRPTWVSFPGVSQVDTKHQHELSVVIPAYNEAEGISQVLSQWTTQLDELSIDYEMLVYDDGSTDEPGTILETLARTNPRLRVTRHSNRGHGPTILKAYHEAGANGYFKSMGMVRFRPPSSQSSGRSAVRSIFCWAIDRVENPSWHDRSSRNAPDSLWPFCSAARLET